MKKKKINERNPEYEAIENRLWEVFGETPRGELITWGKFDAVMGYNHLAYPGMYIFKRFKRRMEKERSLIIDVRMKSGLHFPSVEDQNLKMPEKENRRVYRKQNRLVRWIRLTPTDGASDHAKRFRTMALQQAEASRRRTRYGINQLKSVGKKTEVNPMRKLATVT